VFPYTESCNAFVTGQENQQPSGRSNVKIAISAAAIGLCLAANQSWAGRVEFNGRFHATAANATCITNEDVPNPVSFRFMPPNLGSNGPATSLSIFYEQGAGENYKLASGSLIGTTYKTITATGMGASGAGSIPAKMRIRSQVPAVPTATTMKITIIGDIQNYEIDPGCKLSFIATGYLK
jgi:hypothetical protein